MSTGLLALLAFSPILLAAVLLIGLRWQPSMPCRWYTCSPLALRYLPGI